jgi:hypothetical protein
MRTHTTAQLAALKDSPRIYYALNFRITDTVYRFTTTDTAKTVLGQSYIPGFLDEMDEIEITSQPRVNDNTVVFSDPQLALTTALLSGKWMNQPATIYKVFEDKLGVQFLVKNAFEGLISEYSLNYEDSTVELTISSVWADFEKQSGIKTNAKSQQRYYPNDTAFEHSSSALEKIYWGKDAPASGNRGGGGGGGGTRFAAVRER